MEFNNKVVFIISYENWGQMLMSKHHYAIELGKKNNRVYFINHPDKRYELKRGEVKVSPTEYKNVFAVHNRLIHPYFLKYKYTRLYNFLVRWHIKNIIRKIGSQPDIVWSFDAGNTIPIKYFSTAEVKIFMPVDGPFGHKHEKQAAEKANVIISVTDRILETFKYLNKPMLEINHGVAEVFLHNEYVASGNNTIRVGYSGSLVRNDLDIKTFLSILTTHSDKIFEFWGENDFRKSSIHLPQDISNETRQFLDKLFQLPNVVMHGPVSSADLAEGIKEMDILLICYNIKNDQNHHKVLEYLGTGKVIVSNYLSSYKYRPGLIEMVEQEDSNIELPDLFEKISSNLNFYNSREKQEKRISFAKEYSYASNIVKIQNFINESLFN